MTPREHADALYRNHLPRLRGLALRHGAGDRADDVVHDAIVALLRERPGFDTETHALAWASTRVKWEAWRLHRPRAGRDTDAPTPEPAPVADFYGDVVPFGRAEPSRDLADQVAEALDFAAGMRRLSPRQHRAVSLRAVGYNEAEVTEIEGCTIRGHRSRYRKGREKLRKAVA